MTLPLLSDIIGCQRNLSKLRKNCIEEVKGEISDWPSFLEDLHNDSAVINALNNSNIHDLDLGLNDRATKEVNRSLVGINAVGTTQSYVIFLALIRNYEKTRYQ